MSAEVVSAVARKSEHGEPLYFQHTSFYPEMATSTPWEYSTNDMTVIVSVYTPEGFVVGADGLRMSANKKTVVSNSTQKLFHFYAGNIRLIYGWCGNTQFFGRNGECLFDFIAQTEPLLSAASVYAPVDCVAFLHFIRIGLDTLLWNSKLVRRGDSFPLDIQGELARMLLIGYFHSTPFKAEIKILVEDQMLKPVMISQCQLPLHPLKDIFSGSQRAFEGFESVHPADRVEALKFVRNYIQACIDRPDSLQTYGGHIHIAELDQNEFDWVEPPI